MHRLAFVLLAIIGVFAYAGYGYFIKDWNIVIVLAILVSGCASALSFLESPEERGLFEEGFRESNGSGWK